MPNMELIQSVTVGSGGASSIDFTSIPQTYTDLIIKISTRSTVSSVIGYVNVRFNSDTGNNYSYKAVGGTGSGTFNNNSTSGSSVFTVTAGNNSTSNTFGNAEIYIPNYTGSNQKSISIDGVGENNATEAYTQLVAGLWSGTSAITSIQLSDIFGPGNFVQNTTAYLYGVTNVTSSAKASGGTITSDGAYIYHTFTSSGTFTPTQSLTADYLVVAGGGGAGYSSSVNGTGTGGGGAGGLRSTVTTTGGGGSLETPLSLTAQAYTVTVGAGGTGGTSASVDATDGSNSVFSTITSTGGGGSRSSGLPNGAVGRPGGSGAGNSNADTGAANTGTANQGFAGGKGAGTFGTGGGGGAGQIGGTASGNDGGTGGNGLAISITGSSVNYAGGGAGGRGVSGAAAGVAGTGGTAVNTNGTANTGAGGGGANSSINAGYAGGSGIVIVRYAV